MIGARDAGGRGNVLEAPATKITIERIACVEAAKVKVAEAVAIDVARSDTGAVEENLVGD